MSTEPASANGPAAVISAPPQRPPRIRRSTLIAMALVLSGVVTTVTPFRASCKTSSRGWLELSWREGRVSVLWLRGASQPEFDGFLDMFDRGRAFLIKTRGDYRRTWELWDAFPNGIQMSGFDLPWLAVPLVAAIVLAFRFARFVSERLYIPTRAERRRARGLCTQCEYDLTGNVSGICPECGTPRTPG
ncbi:MAG: hypothetical protein IT449_03495 [Phycisphaerales bacterium]|nr:hypothetical protein [Phycisphaerales bacterium]